MSVFRSVHPDRPLPVANLADFVSSNWAKFADREAVVDGPSGQGVKYGLLKHLIRKVACGLDRRGFRKGAVVALFTPNIPQYVPLFLGAASIGVILSPANPVYTEEELVYQLSDSGARAIATIPQLLPNALAAKKRLGAQITDIILLVGSAEGTVSFGDLLKNDGEVAPVTINPLEDIACIPYSSGTTGLAKGVLLTHHNITSNIIQTLSVVQPDEYHVVMGILPFYHIYGLVVNVLCSLFYGWKIVTMPKFELEPYLTLIQQHKSTLLYVVPPIMLALANHPIVDKFDLSSVREILSGAAPLGPALQTKVMERLKNVIVRQGYGMTETSPVTFSVPPCATAVRSKAGSVGQAVSHVLTKVVHPETGRLLGVNEDGEIWVKGPNVMKGYLNNPKATAETVDSEGYLHSGDIGHIDADGYLFIVDRMKELIKFKGFQVPPAELEALLLKHPKVADVCVVGRVVKEEELPAAFVVLKPGATATEAEIASFVSSSVANHKWLRGGVIFTDKIEKSAAGKILRRLMRAKLEPTAPAAPLPSKM
eukprot:gnl/Hemi2/18837_TR6241_c0_g1_i1.p1 gnl/Hemi2/18837_TR6241_c0_g1~~gnl/Hemi2/18837_TR6241_c0_g1_i1.p1  ORF type:complete len:549 (-),score=150.89 gnl/Hemi2/18837_TR6241_c0_g1_i1:132-1748(-)